MFKSLKSVLPLALLTGFAFTGCDSGDGNTTTEIKSNVAADAPTPAEATETAAAAEGDTAAAKPKPNPGQQMLDQIRAALKPEIIGPALDKNFALLDETVGGIVDEASAKEALPKLKQFASVINRMNTVSNQVPEESRPIIAEKLHAAAGPLKESIDKLLANKEIAKVVESPFALAMRFYDILLAKFPVQTDEPDGTEGAEESEESTQAAEETEENPAE